jgi:hypothetical protein
MTDTPITDEVFEKWKDDPTNEENCPWLLASKLERELNRVYKGMEPVSIPNMTKLHDILQREGLL